MKIFKFIIDFFNNKRTIRDLESLVMQLELENKSLIAQMASPKKIIEGLFSKGIRWYDYSQMSLPEQRNYYKEAQFIINSKVFQNEKKYLIATGAQEVLIEHLNGDSRIRDFQMTINGMQLLENRLEEIVDPDKPQQDFDEQSEI